MKDDGSDLDIEPRSGVVREVFKPSPIVLFLKMYLIKI